MSSPMDGMAMLSTPLPDPGLAGSEPRVFRIQHAMVYSSLCLALDHNPYSPLHSLFFLDYITSQFSSCVSTPHSLVFSFSPSTFSKWRLLQLRDGGIYPETTAQLHTPTLLSSLNGISFFALLNFGPPRDFYESAVCTNSTRIGLLFLVYTRKLESTSPVRLKHNGLSWASCSGQLLRMATNPARENTGRTALASESLRSPFSTAHLQLMLM